MTKITCDARSFGEAYHAAAAAILNERVLWRVVNGSERSRELACSFLNRCAPSRSHSDDGHATRATKFVADAFKKNRFTATATLRSRWIDDSLGGDIKAFADLWLGLISGEKVLVWNRGRDDYESERNTSPILRDQVFRALRGMGLFPILIGHPIDAPRSPCNLTGIWNEPGFDSYISQLNFVDYIKREHGVIASVGNRSGGMDGNALLGMPTLYFEDPSSPKQKKERMEQWIDIVPDYGKLFINDSKEGLPHMTSNDISKFKKWISKINKRKSGSVSLE